MTGAERLSLALLLGGLLAMAVGAARPVRRATAVAGLAARRAAADATAMRILRPSSLATALLATAAALACTPASAGAAAPRTGYVTSVGGGSVTPFDAFSGVFGTPIPLAGSNSWGVAITPDGAPPTSPTSRPTAWFRSTPRPGWPARRSRSATRRACSRITPDGAKVYVANIFSDTVTPIDTATNTPGAPIPVGTSPHGVAIAPDGSRAYVTNFNSGSVSAIDIATDTIIATISVGGPAIHARDHARRRDRLRDEHRLQHRHADRHRDRDGRHADRGGDLDVRRRSRA